MDVLMPQLGETVIEGTVSRWFKSVGEPVRPGEALFEIETDKVAMEVPATEAGTLVEIRGGEGSTLPVGAVVAVIGDGDAGAAPGSGAKRDGVDAAQPSASAPAPALTAAPAAQSSAPRRGFGPFSEVATPEVNFGPARVAPDLRVTPLARRMAAEKGLDIAEVATAVRARGGWRIAKADIESHSASRPAARTPAPPVDRTGADIQPLGRIRRVTAERLASAWAAVPHVLQAVEVDFSAVEAARIEINAQRAARGRDRFSYLPFIARAVAIAVRDFPRVNASVDGDDLVVHRELRLGIAVDLAHQGLVVPVIAGAGELNLIGLADAIGDRVARARAGTLGADELRGGTYTLSNSGSFGTLITAPIVNPPEVAILSTDGVRRKPVVVSTGTGEAIAIRPVGILAQSFDHRAFDGAYSAAYLDRLRDILETRAWVEDAG